MNEQNPQIEPSSFVLTIDEYGKRVRQYADKDKARFDKVVKQMIADHLENSSAQRGIGNSNEIKNITIQVYTY